MRRFSFTRAEIEAHRDDRVTWHQFVRLREAQMVFSTFAAKRFGAVLELGAGNGTQSVVLAEHCDRLVCTEINEQSHTAYGVRLLERALPGVEYRICDATNLSMFREGEFDLVYSSNLLEHVCGVDRCLMECRRVLKDDGLMLHLMPSRWWKFWNFCLDLMRFRWPEVHGVSGGHVQEFVAFGAGQWGEVFKRCGWRIEEVMGLPYYVGHGNAFIPLIKLGNALGLSAVYAYVARKDTKR